MGVQSSKEGGSYEIINAREGILKKAGCQEREFEQIEEAVGKTVYTLNGEEEISAKRARELPEILSGE